MPFLPHLSSFHLLNLESETGSHTAGDGSKPSNIWLYTRRSVCSNATPTVLGQEPQLLSNQADTAPNVKIITSWVQSVACCGQIWKVAWLRLKGRRQLEGEEWHLHWVLTDVQTLRREEAQKHFKPEKLPASKPKAGSCWLCFGNSKEDSVAGSENGEGTQEEDGLGILFWVQSETAEGL